MPAIFHWPGTVAPRVSEALGSTLDLLPTLLELSGAPPTHTHLALRRQSPLCSSTLPGAAPPPGLVLDGVSMVPMLLAGGPSQRDAVAYYPQLAQQSRGLYAMRAGKWKVHWKLQGTMQCFGARRAIQPTRLLCPQEALRALAAHLVAFPGVLDQLCTPATRYHELPQPLAFDLELDAGEQWPLDPASDECAPLPPAHRVLPQRQRRCCRYAAALEAATAARAAHEKKMEWYAGGPQLAWAVGGGWDWRLQPCATPGCSPFPACCATGGAGAS